MTCAKCGSQNRETARFCFTCGASLAPSAATPGIEETRPGAVCRRCGAAAAEGARFCRACGAALEAEASAIAAPAAPVEAVPAVAAPAPPSKRRGGPLPILGLALGCAVLGAAGYLAYSKFARQGPAVETPAPPPEAPAVPQPAPPVIPEAPAPTPTPAEPAPAPPPAVRRPAAAATSPAKPPAPQAVAIPPSAPGPVPASVPEPLRTESQPPPAVPAAPAARPRVEIFRPDTTAPAAPAPAAVPAAQPAKAAYSGPASGTLIWSGQLNREATVTIQGSQASSGTVQGELPGVPVMVTVSPNDVGVAESPGPQSGWKRLVLRSRVNRRSVVTIEWVVLK